MRHTANRPSHRRPLLSAALATLALLGLVGCQEDLPDAARIERVRLLGAGWTPLEAPERAWPRPGETAEARWMLAFPGEARPLDAVLAACPAASGRYGLPQCEAGVTPQPLAPCDDTPPWQLCGRLPVPETEAEQLLLLGVLCVDGRVRLEPGAEPPLGCSPERDLQEGLLLRTPLWRGEGEPNRHPGFSQVLLDGTPLPAVPDGLRLVATEGCPDMPELPRLEPFDGTPGEGEPPHRIGLELPEGAAEPLEEGGREQLVTAHLVTAGKLARRFGSPAPSGDGSSLQTEVGYWPPPPEEVPDAGRLVRLHVTVRDGRGGFSETVRALCVKRP